MGFYLQGETGARSARLPAAPHSYRAWLPGQCPFGGNLSCHGCRWSLPGFENENGRMHRPPQSLTGAWFPRSFQKAPWSPWGVWWDRGDLSAGTWSPGPLTGPGHSTPAAVSGFQREAGGSRPHCHPNSQTESAPRRPAWREPNPKSPPPVASLAKAQAAGHRPSRSTRHRFPWLASLTGSQHCRPDTLARPAEGSLAPGPKLRPPELRTELSGAPGHGPTALATGTCLVCPSPFWGSQCPCLPGQLQCSGAMGVVALTGHSRPQHSLTRNPTDRQALGEGLLFSPSSQRPETHMPRAGRVSLSCAG